MLLGKLITGDEIHRYQKTVVVNFTGPRKVLSTSPANGGMCEGLTAVFNNDITTGAGMAAELKAPTYAEHNAILSLELGLDPEKTAGIGTAAQMENVSIKTEAFKDISVTAVVTGGVEVNGGRVGDPASWDELEQENIVTHGTINILLLISTNLTDGALTRSLVTCTEAKTAALQELSARSHYSQGLATGSGSDGTIIVCNADSAITLSDAGKHVKLGELIGKTVKAAVKEALKLQTGLSPNSQHDVLSLLSRFGITEETLWKPIHDALPSASKAHFVETLETLFKSDRLVTGALLFAHLLDQLDWGLIRPIEATEYVGLLSTHMGIASLPFENDDQPTEPSELIAAFSQGLAKLVEAALIKKNDTE